MYICGLKTNTFTRPNGVKSRTWFLTLHLFGAWTSADFNNLALDEVPPVMKYTNHTLYRHNLYYRPVYMDSIGPVICKHACMIYIHEGRKEGGKGGVTNNNNKIND